MGLNLDRWKIAIKKFERSLPLWVQKIINVIDTPFDKFKELLYNDGKGRAVFGYRFFFNCIMGNKEGECKIEKE